MTAEQQLARIFELANSELTDAEIVDAIRQLEIWQNDDYEE